MEALVLRSRGVTAFATFATSRNARLVGRGLLAVLVGFPILWVLFFASGTSFGPAVSDPKNFLITLLNGLTAAALYFVVASGFTLIFGLMRVVNMAHGAFFLLGGYIALRLQRNMVGGGSDFGISSAQVSFMQWLIPVLAGAAVVAGVGLLMQQLFLRWNQGQDLRQALITIAVSIILADQLLAHNGGVAQDISWPGTFDKFVNLHVAGVQYTLTRLVILGIGLVIGLALWYWLKRTRTGMVIRAGVDDRDMVSVLGINVQLIFGGAFLLGALLAGFGGVLGGTMIALSPGEDTSFLLNSLIVVIIGGMGSLGGAAIGAAALGLVSAYADVYLTFGDTDLTNYSILVTFALLVVVLALRPLGLFGRPA